MKKTILGFCAVLLLALSACGGGGTSATTSATTSTVPTLAAGAAVTLSGTVASGTSAGGIAVGVVSGAVVGTTVNGIYANAIVLAVDKNGNTITTTADNTGKFTLNLKSGVNYGLIFMDGKTLKVLGSLVQANAQNTAGAVALNGNGNLGTIVINPATGHAVSANQATGKLTNTNVVSASAAGLSSNANGTIKPANIASMQATTLQNNPTALTTISTFDYFEKPGTWWQNGKQVWSQGTGFSYDLGVASKARVPGPFKSQVDVTKSSYGQYYTSFTSNGITTAGYYTQGVVNTSPYLSTTFSPPPTQYAYFSGPWTWNNFSYNDVVNNQIYDGSRTGNGINQNAITWSKGVQSTLKLGTPFTGGYSDTMGTGAFKATVTIAKENGAPYVLTEANGLKHPVILLDMVDTLTPDPVKCKTNLVNNPQACKVIITKSRGYMVNGYGGIQADAGTAANPILPSAALKNVAFGKIIVDAAGKFKSATSVNPLNATPALLTNAQRDLWLAYLWNNKNSIGIIPQQTAAPTVGVTVTPWFSMSLGTNGALVSPAGFNQATMLPNSLTAGGQTTFTTKVQYMSGTAVTFTYELRVATVYNTAANVTVTTFPGTAINAAKSNGSTSLPISVTSALNIPTIAQLPTGSTFALPNSTPEANAELWLVMKDNLGKKVYESYLDSYTIK